MSASFFLSVLILFNPASPVARVDRGAILKTPSAQTSQQGVGPVQLPTVVVTAQKEPADPQRLPVSVTTVTAETLAAAGLFTIGEASAYTPNTMFTEFTARKLSNPRFRGVGASPANPSITTYFDGVPQLNSNSSSIDLQQVSQIEFIRGPQSALFGRNALGGVINVSSARPSLTGWHGTFNVPLGNYTARDLRGSFSGPLVAGRLAVGGSLTYAARDGFSRNLVTGQDLDSRSALAGKGQLLWTPTSNWEARLIVNGERARDGDYALSDLAGLRANPWTSARDYEGFTRRDIVSTTVLTRREGRRVAFSTTTGFVNWKTRDSTDLDYTPIPLVTRDNREKSFQFTQEVRLASAASAPVRLSDRLALKWQIGAFGFTQNYDQDAVNAFAPFLLSPQLGIPVNQSSPRSQLDDRGVGLFGQGTVSIRERIDLSVGARVDHEHKEATLNTSYAPPIAPARLVVADRDYANVSPQVSAAVRLTPTRTVYATVARGFKAGGFNAVSPGGREIYDEEHTWSTEAGVKTTWADGRVAANATIFYIDWQDLQLNLPDPAVPAQFFIANVGGAASRGVEFELMARPRTGVDLFGMFGYTHARFADGSVSSGADVSGNELPNTPAYTATIGSQLSRPLTAAATLYGRAEVAVHGAFQYDDANTAAQETYALTNLRLGARRGQVFAELWLKNAFDVQYVPVAFAYPNFAPSGFVGENGAPRTVGVNLGLTF